MKIFRWAVAIWALCLGSVVLAAEASKETVTTTTTTGADGKVMVIKTRKFEGPAPDVGKAATAPCAGEHQRLKVETDQPSEHGHHVKIVMCGDPNAKPEEMALRLAEARQRISGDQTLNADVKARILKDMDEEIARQGMKPAGG